jgi:hypothetical protein
MSVSVLTHSLIAYPDTVASVRVSGCATEVTVLGNHPPAHAWTFGGEFRMGGVSGSDARSRPWSRLLAHDGGCSLVVS